MDVAESSLSEDASSAGIFYGILALVLTVLFPDSTANFWGTIGFFTLLCYIIAKLFGSKSHTLPQIIIWLAVVITASNVMPEPDTASTAPSPAPTLETPRSSPFPSATPSKRGATPKPTYTKPVSTPTATVSPSPSPTPAGVVQSDVEAHDDQASVYLAGEEGEYEGSQYSQDQYAAVEEYSSQGYVEEEPQNSPVMDVVHYKNCRQVCLLVGRPLRSDEIGYGPELDADGDGIACEWCGKKD
ncbi:excalibur calcium-binding domain-containing protein [Actinotignum sp. UMB0459]|uniref:excalibur calcium-binding domain-containing protein n=1 Tax=Actinotignum sp. UMB0459 TaxID=3449314 RepID=UPI003F75EC6F